MTTEASYRNTPPYWKTRIDTITFLRLARAHYRLSEISNATEMPPPMICRYLAGKHLPTPKQATHLRQSLLNLVGLNRHLLDRIEKEVYETGYFDNTQIITDPLVLETAVNHAMDLFEKCEITKVITPAVDGIPLATLLAHRIGVDVIVAKKEKDRSALTFIEGNYTPKASGLIISFYVPNTSVHRGDHVLIVDDVIRDEGPQTALVDIIKQANANIAGIFALIGIGNEWKTLGAKHKCPAEVIAHLKPVSKPGSFTGSLPC